ncbi:hypothetical protein LEMLEM_LOCUS23957 [Lemmus lemmus]
MPPLLLKQREEPIRKSIYVKWRCCEGRRMGEGELCGSLLDDIMRLLYGELKGVRD